MKKVTNNGSTLCGCWIVKCYNLHPRRSIRQRQRRLDIEVAGGGFWLVSWTTYSYDNGYGQM